MPAADLSAQRMVLDRVGSLEREQAVLYAKQARARAEMSALWGGDQGVLLELAGTARIGQGRAGGQLSRAERLVQHLPVALGLLELGAMRVGTVEILLEVSKSCSAQVQQLLDARLSERICVMDAVDARRLIVTTIPELEGELEAEAQRERHERARANRGVWAFPVEDGMARIGAELDQSDAARWSLDFEELVRAQKVIDDRDGVTRTQAQRRADVFAALPSQLLALADAAAKDRLLDVLASSRTQGSAGASSVTLDLVPDASLIPAGPPPVASAEARDMMLDSLERAVPLVDRACEREELLMQLLRLPVRNPRVLNVHVGMTTLLDLDQRSGWLEGFGPVPAMHARMLLADARLRRVAVDERTGVPLGVDPLTGARPPWKGEFDHPAGRHRHRPERTPAEARRQLLLMIAAPAYLSDGAEPQHDPSVALRKLTRLRDQACDGPGCPRSTAGCELDHELDYALGGPTAAWNLRHRSTRCHHAKHAGWTVEHDPDTAVTTWISPAGSEYERRSPWQPPLELPEDVELPEPRFSEPLDITPDRVEDDRPLWREPEPPQPRLPRRARGIDPDTRDEYGNPLPAPQPKAGRSWTTWDDGPPPF